MNWTEDQERAVMARGTNLLLSAAAGSGKTTVLVGRVLELLKEGDSIDRMLIVTFSRAAAADMRAKLMEKLQEGADDANLRRQLHLLENARVCTIHAFCGDLIREYFQEISIDPSFRIADPAEIRRYEMQALEETLDAAWEAGGEGLKRLAYGKTADQLGALVQEVYRYAMEQPEPEMWLQRALVDLPQGDGGIWREQLLSSAREALDDAREFAQSLIAYCEHHAERYIACAAGDARQLSHVPDEEYNALQEALAGYRFARAPVLKDKTDAETAYGVLRDDLKARVKEAAAFLIPFDAGMADVRDMADALAALREIVVMYMQNLFALKRARRILTYSDLEQCALKILKNDAIAEHERNKFSHVFVDEYQDVSDVQEAIIRRVSRRNGLFMVGDVKQSIYRFRQADPELFLEKYAAYRAHDGGEMVALKQNFRSRGAILEFVNRVFSRVMTGGSAEIDYDEDARLVKGGTFAQDDPLVEMLLIPTGDDAAEGDEPSPKSKIAQGRATAEKIRSLYGKSIYDPKKKEMRPISWRDFAILARTRNTIMDVERVLADAGIPCYADVDSGYWEAAEVTVALSLLTLLVNRRRDMELLTVLRSPIFGFTDAELAEIRLCKKDGMFRDAMLCAMEMGGALGNRLREAEELLSHLTELSARGSLERLLYACLHETGYYAYVGAMPDGDSRQSNLDSLCSLAYRRDREHADGLIDFLEYIRHVSAASEDSVAAHLLGEGDDVVRLMTAHKSKGLEFPIVLCISLEYRGRKQSITDLWMDRDLGIGMAFYDAELDSIRSVPAQAAIRAKKARQDRNEEMRVLYVMLTRAQDRLILLAEAPKKELPAEVHARPRTWLEALLPVVREGEDIAILSSGTATEDIRGASRDENAILSEWLESPPAEKDAYFEASYAFRYPHEGEWTLPLKLTATGASREITGADAIPEMAEKPLFLTDQTMTGAQRGTLIHALLSCLDLDKIRPLSGGDLRREIRAQADAMLADGRLYADIDTAQVARFFEGEMGQRLLRAQEVRREWSFNLSMTAREALHMDSDARLLVQGVIDCCFLEGGKWVLIDYKTDRADDLELLKERYRPQLAIYQKALPRITGKPVAQAVLCILSKNLYVDMTEPP